MRLHPQPFRGSAMNDFVDTVPVDMSGFVGIQCDNCGAMSDPSSVVVSQVDGLAWICPHCGSHNFEDGPHEDLGGETEDSTDAFLDEIDAICAADPADELLDDEPSGGVSCPDCGEFVAQEYLDEADARWGGAWVCPHCGGERDA